MAPKAPQVRLCAFFVGGRGNRNNLVLPGIKRGGTVNLVLHSVEMMVPGDAIPDGITVDLTGIDIGKSIHISMIALPENCTPVDRSDFTIATVVASAGMKEAPAAEAPAARPGQDHHHGRHSGTRHR
jgi:large subunit ribosomal protein L25